MAQDFSTPPGVKPKIAETKPVESDPERAKLYGPLMAVNEELKKELEKPFDMGEGPVPQTVQTAPEPEPATQPLHEVDLRSVPTEEDKVSFLKSILGSQRYSKIYPFFRDWHARFEDRTTPQTEFMYRCLTDLQNKGAIKTDADYNTYYDRYCLALQLRQFRLDRNVTELPDLELSQDKLDARVAQLIALPKPVYLVIMDLNRVFENHVLELIEKATDVNFWTPEGQSSQFMLPAQAR